ncbi:hypothetical protein ASPACDRAFT_77125 [Aspergillus aculeatus ATCC 16872]|uniref:Uncharacterized protein n=1 Tax=Aspergillus aculeatus (strain ATCC 16872 / CBS 172.66 / WB 5094) TaxID=690307 RepID=A0A1L9WYM6_ASPA1|nr:uncharacterized protein ASPACDRAFT_77125 [Aspergillus aculeatus ATCC 16872]OJK01352.1 hypothetical protein ASPACDRAFT_77125 [Aspergillus aculeatus ATCC 16872]
MRLSYRIGTAALLIVAIFLIKRHLDLVQDDSRVQSGWSFNGVSGGPGSSDAATNDKSKDATVPASKEEIPVVGGGKKDQPAAAADDNDDGIALGSRPVYETTPIIVPNDRVIVMAKLAAEDTAWVSNDLADWRNYIYTVDDVNAAKHTPQNKGRESLAYLQYIIEHYDDLPSTIVFIHSHRDGYPGAWHTDTMEYSNVDSIRALQTDFVQRNGYANLRCQMTPGCPDEIRPFRNPPQSGQTTERVYADAWEQLFNNTDVPEVVAVACCSQFAVSRDQVLQRPLSDYMWFYEWVLTTPLSDKLAAGVMEYTWHIIFGQEPVYCPDSYQCYEDVYGNPYFW